LQISIYYDKSLEVVAKTIYPLNFYSGLSICPLQWVLFRDCRAIVKMTQLRRQRSSFHEHGSNSGFRECGSSSSFWSFSHIVILVVLVCLKL